MNKLQSICKSVRENAYLICATIVVLYVTIIVGNAVLEGVGRIITQHQIDETYRIER